MASLMATGTPASGPSASPRARLASIARAWASAPSRGTSRKALSSPSYLAICSSAARVTASADVSPARTRPAMLVTPARPVTLESSMGARVLYSTKVGTAKPSPST